MNAFWLLPAAIGGYILSIYTWPAVRLFFNGAEDEALWLRDRARAIESALRGQGNPPVPPPPAKPGA